MNVLLVKAKQKNRKQMLLKRLMLFGLKPSLRMAALKMLMCKKKKISLCDLSKDELDGESMFFKYTSCLISYTGPYNVVIVFGEIF